MIMIPSGQEPNTSKLPKVKRTLINRHAERDRIIDIPTIVLTRALLKEISMLG
jgi:hypothetical protein